MMRRLNFLWNPDASALKTMWALFGATLAYLFVTAPPFRAVQIWSFTIPFGLLLLAVSSLPRGWRRTASFIAAIGFLPIWVESGVRGYLRYVHAAEPNSEIVLFAVANTTPGESIEFLQHELGDVLLWTAATLAVAAFGLWRLMRFAQAAQDAPRPSRFPRTNRTLLLLLIVISAFSWIQRPWRGNLPPNYWLELYGDVQDLRKTWAEAAKARPLQIEFARNRILSTNNTPRTLVLVIGESTNRDNWSLYGYSRQTTPKLEALAADDAVRLGVVRDAWSVDSSTVPAFRSMLTTALPGTEVLPDGRLNLIAAFKAAGWRITWISNQEDSAIRNEYAGYADRAEMLNRVSGRSSVSMDEKVLAYLKATLGKHSAERRLIVVHLIGAHPHYRLRRPEKYERDWGDDAVAQRLEDLDRSIRVQEASEDYDEVMLYQDAVISRSLELARDAAKSSPVSWIYLSDHGQELGLSLNRTGHSATTASGYRIPLLLWASDADRRSAETNPFRADWFPALLLDEAGIQMQGVDRTESLLNPEYHWIRPNVPFEDPDMDRVSAE